MLFGPRLFERTTLELIADGYLRRPTVVPVRVPLAAQPSDHRWRVECADCGGVNEVRHAEWAAGEAYCTQPVAAPGKKKLVRCGAPLRECMAVRGNLDWTAAVGRWAESPEAERAVLELGRAALEGGHAVLALAPRREAAASYAQAIRRGTWHSASHAVSGSATRSADIEALRDGSLDFLAATQLADEGLDVPRLSCLIVASCGKDPGITQQRAGRVCRPADKPAAVVLDLVPDTLQGQWRKRRAAYVRAFGPECLVADDPVPLDTALDAIARVGGAPA